MCAVLRQVLFGAPFFKRHGLQAVQQAFLDFEGNFEVMTVGCSVQYIQEGWCVLVRACVEGEEAGWTLAAHTDTHTQRKHADT